MSTNDNKPPKPLTTFQKVVIGTVLGLTAAMTFDIIRMGLLVNKLEDQVDKAEENVQKFEASFTEAANILPPAPSYEDTSTPPDQQSIEQFETYFGSESMKTMRIEQDSLKMDLIDGGPIPRDWEGQTKSATMTYNIAARKNVFDVVHMDGREKISDHDFSVFTGYYHQIMQIKACETAKKQPANDFLTRYCPAP